MSSHRSKNMNFLAKIFPVAWGYAYFIRACLSLKNGQYADALADLSQAIAYEPGNTRYYLVRGGVYETLEDLDAALLDYRFCHQHQAPNLHYIYTSCARVKINRNIGNDLNAAIADATTAIRLKPNYADAYTLRAIAYCFIGEYDKAMDDAEKAIHAGLQISGGYRARALTHHMLKNYAAAIMDYDEAIRRESGNPWCYYRR